MGKSVAVLGHIGEDEEAACASSQPWLLSLFRKPRERFGMRLSLYEPPLYSYYETGWLIHAPTAESLHFALVMSEVVS